MKYKQGLHYFFYFSIIAAFCFLTGCLPAPYYQKEETIPNNAWNYNFRPSFEINITDTAVNYQPYFLIQHTQAYPFGNIWVWVHIKAPGDTIGKKERVNVTLAEPNGKWLGRGMGEIYEQRMRMDLDSVNFRKKGTYKIAFEQNMRVTPLPDVLHVGLRLEKVEVNTHKASN